MAYIDDDSKIADLLSGVISPVEGDPDEAVVNRDAVLQRIAANAPKTSLGTPIGDAAPTASPTKDASAEATPAAVTPSGQPKTWADYSRAGLDRSLQATDLAMRNVQNLENMPDVETTLAPLEQQRAEAAKYIDPRQQQYRPGVGQKILRGIRATMTGGIPGALSENYNAPNRRYQQDVAAQQAQVGTLDQQIKQARDRFKARADDQKARAQEARALATSAKDITSGAVSQEQEENAAARAANETPEAKAKEKQLVTQQEYNDRTQKLQTDPLLRKLPSGAKAYYLTTGKTPDPHQPTAEEIMFGRAMQAWEQDPANKGKRPTLDDINKIAASSRGSANKGGGAAGQLTANQKATIEGKKNDAIAQAKRDYQSGMDKQGNVVDYDEFLNRWQDAQNKYEQELRAATGNDISHVEIRDNVDDKGNWTGPKEQAPAAPSPQPAAAPKQGGGKLSHKVGDVVTVGGKQMRITGIQNGKYQGVPVQ